MTRTSSSERPALRPSRPGPSGQDPAAAARPRLVAADRPQGRRRRRRAVGRGDRRVLRAARAARRPGDGHPEHPRRPGAAAHPGRAGARSTQQYGLDRPVIVQYLDYLRGLVVGDFGTSYQQYRPVTAIIGEQLGATVDAVAHRDRVRLGAHGRLGHPHRRSRPAARRRRVDGRCRRRRACPPTGSASSCCWSSGSACAGSRSSAARGVERARPAGADARHPARRLHGAEHAGRVRAGARAALRPLGPDARDGRRGASGCVTCCGTRSSRR